MGVAAGIAAAAVVGAVAQGVAAEDAEDAQHAQTQAGIKESRRAQEEANKLLDPYVQLGIPATERLSEYEGYGSSALPALGAYAQSGYDALGQQRNLIGLEGQEAQQQAIDEIQQGPLYQAMVQQSEDALLQNASATGGLRGGNTQRYLSQLRPNILNQLVDQRYSRLGGLTTQGGNIAQNLASQGLQTTSNLASLGQASAAGQASTGLESAAGISKLLQQQGAATAGAQLAQGKNYANLASRLGGAYAYDQGVR